MRSPSGGLIAILVAGCGGGGGGAPLDAALARPDAARAMDAAAPADLAQPNLAAALAALTAGCQVASSGRYATDDGLAPTIDICKLNGAFFWKSDMDVDCDGQTTPECNLGTDPAYQNQTSFTQSDGQPLIAARLPFVVVPLPSSRFDYMAADIRPGALAIVLYAGQLSYGVFGDEGPDNIIGEGSYAMAKSLGIDPDPSTGGVDSGVTFFLFTGAAAVVDPIESTTAAQALGPNLAAQLLASN